MTPDVLSHVVGVATQSPKILLVLTHRLILSNHLELVGCLSVAWSLEHLDSECLTVTSDVDKQELCLRCQRSCSLN